MDPAVVTQIGKELCVSLSYLPCKVLGLMNSSRIVDKVISSISSACGDAYPSIRNHVVAPDFYAMSVDIRLSVDVWRRGAPDYSNSGYQVLVVPQIRFAWSGRNSWGEFTLLSPGFPIINTRLTVFALFVAVRYFDLPQNVRLEYGVE